MPRQLNGAAAIAKVGLNFSPTGPVRQARAGRPVGRTYPGPARGRLSLALRLTVANGKITGMDVVADPERLGQLTLGVLDV